MKRLTALLLTLLLTLSLSACKAREEHPAPPASAVSPGERVEKTEKKEPQLTEMPSVSAQGETIPGRTPAEDYRLPEKTTDMTVWMDRGGIGLLTELEEAAFYAIEGKEFSPALIRWGDALAEFDWAYITPRAFAPRLWCFDYDGDGAEELVVDCYYGSGTGVSLSDLYVVERAEDGALSAVKFPVWLADSVMTNSALQLVEKEGKTFAALGTELVDITQALAGNTFRYRGTGLTLGAVRRFERQGDAMQCTLGVMADTEDAPFCYVAELTADVLYRDGNFILDGWHLEGY